MSIVYVVFNDQGEALGDADTLEDAVEAAEDLGAGEVYLDQTAVDESEDDLTPNRTADAALAWDMITRLPPLPGRQVVQRAGEPLRIDPGVCEDMTLEEAYERLLPLLPTYKGAIRKNVSTPAQLRDWFLGTNEKTDMSGLKKDVEEYARVTGERPPKALLRKLAKVSISGLSLLPAWFWYKTYKGEDSIVEYQGRRVPLRDVLRGAVNLCSGSSPECRSSCLVGTGKNEADPWNVMVKIAKTSMFMLDPEAFMVMLMHNITMRTQQSHKAGYDQFIRLNVFQDVPWELVFPEIFEFFPEVQFYDYTKVQGRETPKNYDLTYSYSGRNMVASVAEMKRGRRVAAVFHLGKHVFPRTMPWGPGLEIQQGRAPSRTETMEVPVVDGDLSDVRPFDPAPSVVALSYKTPSIRAGTPSERIERIKSGKTAKGVAQKRIAAPPFFIVPATRMEVIRDGKVYLEGYVLPVVPKAEATTFVAEGEDDQLTGTYGGRIPKEKLRLPVLPPEES